MQNKLYQRAQWELPRGTISFKNNTNTQYNIQINKKRTRTEHKTHNYATEIARKDIYGIPLYVQISLLSNK